MESCGDGDVARRGRKYPSATAVERHLRQSTSAGRAEGRGGSYSLRSAIRESPRPPLVDCFLDCVPGDGLHNQWGEEKGCEDGEARSGSKGRNGRKDSGVRGQRRAERTSSLARSFFSFSW